jgi:hypothetical protein
MCMFNQESRKRTGPGSLRLHFITTVPSKPIQFDSETGCLLGTTSEINVASHGLEHIIEGLTPLKEGKRFMSTRADMVYI